MLCIYREPLSKFIIFKKLQTLYPNLNDRQLLKLLPKIGVNSFSHTKQIRTKYKQTDSNI